MKFKIYCIIDINGLKYVGKTKQTFNRRFSKHKNKKDCSSKLLDLDNCQMILLCECEDHEAKYREQYFKDNIKCVNKYNAVYDKNKTKQTTKQYRQKNKEKIKQRQKKYDDQNKDKKKQYYLDNIEHKKKYNKEYYINNKEQQKQDKKKSYNYKKSWGGNKKDNNNLLEIDINLFNQM